MRKPFSTTASAGLLPRLLLLATLVPATSSILVGGSAWAASDSAPRVTAVERGADPCTPSHLSGCDGTDDPSPGDGRTLRYCNPEEVCTPISDPRVGLPSHPARIRAGAPARPHHAGG